MPTLKDRNVLRVFERQCERSRSMAGVASARGGLGKEVSEVVGADRGCVEDHVRNWERIPKRINVCVNRSETGSWSFAGATPSRACCRQGQKDRAL